MDFRYSPTVVHKEKHNFHVCVSMHKLLLITLKASKGELFV